jgi:hypothetical protein
MDTVMMRKRGSRGTTARPVCVTSIGILRSGVRGNHHAPIWSSGRRSDPSVDCNYQEMTPQRQHPPVRLKQQHLNQIRLDEPSLAEFDTFILKRRKP